MEAPKLGSPEALETKPSTWLSSLAEGFDSFAKPLKSSVETFTRSVSESFAQSSTTSPTREASLPDEGPHNIALPSLKSELKGPGYAPIGFSFSPAGLLMPYHLGVVEYLEHTGWLTPNVPIGGASAGAIVVVCTALRIGTTRLMPHLYAMEANLRQKGTARRLYKQLRLRLTAVLPEDSHELLAQRPRPVYVVYTNVMPWKAQKVSTFESKEDLIQCVLASCNIPFYFHKRPTVKCRDAASIDGYFADRANFGCPPMPCVRRQVRVLPFCAHDVLGSASPEDFIAPDLSQFDDEIPDSDYEAFMAYLKKCPAPNAEGERRSSVTEPALPQGPSVVDFIEESFTAEKARDRQSSMPSSPTETPQRREVLSDPEPPLPSEAISTEREAATEGARVVAAGKEDEGESVGSRCFGRRLPFASGGEAAPKEEAAAVEGEGEWGFWGMGTKSFLSSFLHAISPGPSKGAAERSALTPTQITSYSGVGGRRSCPKGSRRHSELPISKFSWRTLVHYALNPTEEDHTVRELYDLGRADAFRWVQLQVRRGERPSAAAK